MKIASVGMYSVVGQMDVNLAELERILFDLQTQDVEFALFPELNVLGYTKDVSLIKDFLKYQDLVEDKLKELSLKVDTAFAVGYPIEIKGDYYIAHHVFHRGDLIFTHCKTHLGPTEQTSYKAGNSIEVFSFKECVIGIQLCYETHMPEISYAQAKAGAHLLAMAFASPRETSNEKLDRFKRYLPARAYDNACYVMACNMNGTSFAAIELIINPKGIVLAENTLSTSYSIVDIDLSKITHIKMSKMGWFNGSKRESLF